MMLDADVQRRPDTELWQWLKALWGSCPREAAAGGGRLKRDGRCWTSAP